jgi:osmotically inducible lipoprotein OsmB
MTIRLLMPVVALVAILGLAACGDSRGARAVTGGLGGAGAGYLLGGGTGAAVGGAAGAATGAIMDEGLEDKF